MEKYVITMLGEKDHGKSTLIGSMLIAMDATTGDRIREAKRYSKNNRFEPAYILDSFYEEREKEMTIDTTRAEFAYNKSIYELIDVPGHLELIKNMMSGASNAEIAILMVSLKKGEGFRPQTKRHLFLSSMLGVKSLIVAVNKIDLVNYSEDEFSKMKENVGEYLKKIGFNRPVEYIPVSAYNRDNLISHSNKTKWYKGITLLEAIEHSARRMRKDSSRNRGLRAIIQDSMIDGKAATIFAYISSGTIKTNDSVHIEPFKTQVKIKELYVKGKRVKIAKEGSNISIRCNLNSNLIQRGGIIYANSQKSAYSRSFNAKIFFIHGLLDRRSEIIMNLNNKKVEAIISDINGFTNPSNGNFKAFKNVKIVPNIVVDVKMSLKSPYPIERFSEYESLGRFTLYSKDKFVGIGIVK